MMSTTPVTRERTSSHSTVTVACMCVYMCVFNHGYRLGQVVGLLLTTIGECGFALDIMMGNGSVLVQSFTGI